MSLLKKKPDIKFSKNHQKSFESILLENKMQDFLEILLKTLFAVRTQMFPDDQFPRIPMYTDKIKINENEKSFIPKCGFPFLFIVVLRIAN
jgi:hypothetical protein